MISDVWLLSLESGFSSAVCSYDVVKEYSKEHKLHKLDVYRVCKSMTNKFNAD